MTEREGPQERPHRGRRHRLEPQHRAGAARAQHPDVINMGGTGEHRGDHGEDFGPGFAEPDPPLDQPQRPSRSISVPATIRPRWPRGSMIEGRCEPSRCAMMQSQKVPPLDECSF